MLDEERILAKLDELEGYLAELRAIAPQISKNTGGLKKSGVVKGSSSCASSA